MLFLFLIIVGTGILWSLVENVDGSKAMKEFCELECKQNIKSNYKF